jgi:hypothetical protein
LTCWPQPAQDAFSHLLHVTCRHMRGTIPQGVLVASLPAVSRVHALD